MADELDVLREIQHTSARVRRSIRFVWFLLFVNLAILGTFLYFLAPALKERADALWPATAGVVSVEPMKFHCADCECLYRDLRMDTLKARIRSGLAAGTIHLEIVELDKGESKSRHKSSLSSADANGILTFAARPSDADPLILIDTLHFRGATYSGKIPCPDSSDQGIVGSALRSVIHVKPGETRVLWYKVVSDGQSPSSGAPLEEHIKPDATGVLLRITVE